MPSRLPQGILLLTAFAAVAILVGGLGLARREFQERQPQDRTELLRWSTEFQTELRRLESLYQHHLETFLREAPLRTDSFQTRTEANRIVGITQVSLLPSPEGPVPELHLLVNPRQSAPDLPRPAISDSTRWKEPGRPRADLSSSSLVEGTIGQPHWIDLEGPYVFFGMRRTNQETAILTLDRALLTQTIHNSLLSWMDGPKEHALHVADSLVPPSAATTPGLVSPDHVLAFPTPFGVWQVHSRDPVITRISWHRPTLFVSTSLFVLLMIFGMITFLLQRRALRHASQRVSFVNHVSHELRTPLTNIVLNTDLALESLPASVETTHSRLELVREEAGRLSRLISNVLTFSRQESRKLQLHARDCVPTEIIQSALEQFQGAFQRRGIRVAVQGNPVPHARFDPDAFAQILANLLSNVEKYGASGRILELSTGVESDCLIVTVSDQGEGIPPQEQERIFDPFYRLQNHLGEGAAGTGLGLAIARDLAREMNGSLHLLPTETGASFRLEVPLHPDSAPSAQAS